MTSIAIEDYDPSRHRNPMMFVDNVQAERRAHGGRLEPYRVCVVRVAGFEFIFHSATQLELCLEYYRCKILPSSRLPVHTQNLGGDHWETQRWFERLPARLRTEPIRQEVVDALERALRVYILEPGAVTGTPKPDLQSSW
jgi:hypothetical protein